MPFIRKFASYFSSYKWPYCCKTSWKVMLRVLPPGFKPFLQQIRLFQVAKSCCRKQRVVLFLLENLYMLRLPKANLFCSKWQNARIRRDNRIITSRSQYYLNLQPRLSWKVWTWVVGKTHSSKGTDSLYQCHFLVVCKPLNNSSRSLIPFTANVFTVKTKQSTILTTSSNLELK